MDASQFQGIDHLIISGRTTYSVYGMSFDFLPMSYADKPNSHFTYATIVLPSNWKSAFNYIMRETYFRFKERGISTTPNMDEQAVILTTLDRFFEEQLHLTIFDEMRYFTALEFCNNIRLITDEDGDKLRFPCDVEELKNELPF